MTVYMTKTWGFGSPSWPLQFSMRGWRERARDVLQPGDLVVIVGTLGQETAPEERGMVLGLMEPTREIVSSLQFNLNPEPNELNESGQYKWPFALELRNAWRFLEPRMPLSEISTRAFAMDSAMGIVRLTSEEAAKILALPREPVPLLRSIHAAAKIEGLDAARRKAAPPPTTRRTGVMHMRRMSAFTYAMELEGTPESAFKIGWAFDYADRERQFNHASLPQLGGIKYRTRLYQFWETARDAFAMEQALLKSYDGLRHSHNVEVLTPISFDALQSAWIQAVKVRGGR